MSVYSKDKEFAEANS